MGISICGVTEIGNQQRLGDFIAMAEAAAELANMTVHEMQDFDTFLTSKPGIRCVVAFMYPDSTDDHGITMVMSSDGDITYIACGFDSLGNWIDGEPTTSIADAKNNHTCLFMVRGT